MDRQIKENNLDAKSSNNAKTMVDYIWLGGSGSDIRCKSRTISRPVNSLEDVDEWNYDGSSTWQASGEDSEVNLKPVAIFNDPFRGLPNKIVLCETYHQDGSPTVSNFRHLAAKIFEKKGGHEPWFGLEQEYVLLKPTGTGMTWPLGWPLGGYPKPQGSYYCSVGSKFNFGREVSEAHYKACISAGVEIYGTNCEVMPGQWEFQIGTCKGIDEADHLWVARYLLHRTAETFCIDVTFDPKPAKGEWNGSGCHTNYSTYETRNDSNLSTITNHLEKLKLVHSEMISLYGEDNHLRLTGKNETSSIGTFNYGVANRDCSVRIPRTTEKSGKGYYEDRRPAANADPYIVTSAIFSVTCLDKYLYEELKAFYKNFKEHKKQICPSLL